MIFGAEALGIVPFGDFQTLDQSTQPKIAELFQRPDRRRYLLVQVEPWSDTINAVITRNFASGISRISGSSALWDPRAVESYNVTTSIVESLLALGGPGRSAYGTIQIAIADGAKDELVFEKLYDGRKIRVWLGGDPNEGGWTFADYVEVFNGRAGNVRWNERILDLIVRDPATRLDVPLQRNLYAGTGGDEGGDDLKGKPKPIGLGRVLLAPPVLVDREFLIYQLNDGAILGAHSAADGDAIYDRGDAYISDGNLPSVANLRAWTAVASHYITDNALGLIRLGSIPTGVLGVRFRGATESGVFREKRGELIKFLLKARASFVDAEIDLAAIAALDADARTCHYYSANPTTVAESVDALLKPRGYRIFDPTGRFVAGLISIGSGATTIQPPALVSMTREETPLPSYLISLGYARNWIPVREADLATPETTEIDRDFAINEYRRVTVKDDLIWNPATQTGDHPDAQPLEVNTLLTDAEDAQIEVNELMALIGPTRDLYTAVCQRIQFRFRPGQSVRVVYPRYGLAFGKVFVILSVSEAWRSGRTTLQLLG